MPIQLDPRVYRENPLYGLVKSIAEDPDYQFLTSKLETGIHFQERAEKWTEYRILKKIGAVMEAQSIYGLIFDEKYHHESKELVMTILRENTMDRIAGRGYGNDFAEWFYAFNTGWFWIHLCFSFSLSSGVYSDEEKALFKKFMLAHIRYFHDYLPPIDDRLPEHNRLNIMYIACGMMAVVAGEQGWLEEDDKLFDYIEGAKYRSTLFLEKGHDHGSFAEGPNYGIATFVRISIYAWILWKFRGDGKLLEHPDWLQCSESLSYEVIPGSGQINPTNDGFAICNVMWFPLVAKYRDYGPAKWLWEQTLQMSFEEARGKTTLNELQLSRLNHHISGLFMPTEMAFSLLYSEDGLSTVSADFGEFKTSKTHPECGLTSYKTGWGSEDLHLTVLNDNRKRGGRHVQNDRNHFTLNALGELFLIDSGYAMEDLAGTTQVLRTGSQGRAHSLPLINGAFQASLGDGHDSGGIKEVDMDSAYPFIESEVLDCMPQARRFVRRWLHAQPEASECGVIFVADEIHYENPKESHLMSTCLHTSEDNRVTIEGHELDIEGGNLGHHLHVGVISSGWGKWYEDRFAEHPLMRYDYLSADPAVVLHVFTPYRKGEARLNTEAHREKEGFAWSVVSGADRFLLMSARPDQRLELFGHATEKPFAFFHLRDNKLIHQLER